MFHIDVAQILIASVISIFFIDTPNLIWHWFLVVSVPDISQYNGLEYWTSSFGENKCG